MIIYNVTTKVDTRIAEAWLLWMQQEHIPEVMATACFVDYKVVRLLDTDDSEGPTYAVQYIANDRATYQKYIDEFAHELRRKSMERWGNGFISFRTLMEVVH